MPLVAGFMVPHPPMIVPAVGRGSEAQVEETARAYRRVAQRIGEIAPDTIVITSPHTVMYADYMHISPGRKTQGSFAQFGAGGVRFEEEYDIALRDRICALCAERGIRAGMLGERDRKLDHGVMVPLWFIRSVYSGGKIVRIGLSGLPLSEHYRLGQAIRDAAEETRDRIVFVASGDLSHKLQDYGPYGFAPEGPQYDARIMDVMGRAAFGELLEFDETFCEKAAECGHRSFVIMAGAFDGMAVRAQELSHEDVTGVGYGICMYEPAGEDPERCFLDAYLRKQRRKLEAEREAADPYVRLARETVETYVRTGQVISCPEGLPKEMLETRAGAFVSIHEHGKLRGCIGTISPVTGCVAQEIIDNAVSAATRDPRFDPIEEEELGWLSISVDVLGEAEEIGSMDELDVKRYGVIVSKGFRRGLLLPDLDGVDTPEEQVAIARKKAGIGAGETVKLERFEVVRHR